MLKPTPFKQDVVPALGMNTDSNPTQLPEGSQRIAYDACMREMGTISKRPGSAPVTSVALANTIIHMTTYKTSASNVTPELIAISGSSMFKYTGTEFSSITMTNSLNNSEAYTEGFTDYLNASRLIIADTGSLKEYNGTAVQNITPAASDALPLPPNDMIAINAKGPKYVCSHKGHLFISDGTDMLWYSKRYHRDYFPSVQYFRLVRNNDYVTGSGISYNDVLLIPMRRGWGVITGETFDDGASSNPFKADQFLNTTKGNISPRSVARLTYPDGTQTIAFLSDDGVHEIYDTTIDSNGSRQLSTRSIMNGKIDFKKFGFTDAQKQTARSYFDSKNSRLMVSFERIVGDGYDCYTLVYDLRNQEWYVWRTPYIIRAFVLWENNIYMGGNRNYLYAFDENLYSDWSNKAHTVLEKNIDFDVYSGLMSFEFSGSSSYLHYYLVEAQIYNVPSTLDVFIVYGEGMVQLDRALINEIFVWDVTGWDSGVWGNLNYSDNVNNAQRLVIKKKAKYFQRRWRNNRNEPVLILKESFIGTISGR